MKFLIGQRILLNNDEIGTIVKPPKGRENKEGYAWVFAPSRGYESQYAEHNVKPLPNGQL